MDFFKSMGESKSLKHLDIDSGNSQRLNVSDLAKAVAMNSFKQCSLTFLSMKNSILNYEVLENFLENLYISEKDHEEWYGSS